MQKYNLQKNIIEKKQLVQRYLGTQSPFCILPEEYFAEIHDKNGVIKKKKMLSIQSWDGREIFTLERTSDEI